MVCHGLVQDFFGLGDIRLIGNADDFFLQDKSDSKKKSKKDKWSDKKPKESESKAGQASTKEELELLIAGDDGKCKTPFVQSMRHYIHASYIFMFLRFHR